MPGTTAPTFSLRHLVNLNESIADRTVQPAGNSGVVSGWDRQNNRAFTRAVRPLRVDRKRQLSREHPSKRPRLALIPLARLTDLLIAAEAARATTGNDLLMPALSPISEALAETIEEEGDLICVWT